MAAGPALVALQAVQVAILWTHDWLPLGRLNDVAAVRRQDGAGRLVRATLVQSLPFTILLGLSAGHLRSGLPAGLRTALWIAYLILLAGELRAWWVPYLIRREPERARRYAAMFGRTYGFLPARNGISPNALHCMLHLATLATVLTLAATRG